ncbi:MAG: DUF86 domain-containing protein [Methanothrix sp.]|nr:DUF86 domain-containing protein [Methanothrix sp.]MDD4447091.1 DUF86 domain-containing protein [Methanothrix sp.]
MKPERVGRYRDKLDLIILRAGQAQTWLDEQGSEDFLADDKTKLATYKAFQEAVEASMDLVAMMCKDLGSTPQDDYGNLDRLKVLKESSREVLKEANGLRNHLIHRYNKRDDQLAWQSMADLIPGIFAFTKEVAAWLERILSQK